MGSAEEVLPGTAMCIFRRGSMRLGDNHVLAAAAKHEKTYCVYVLEQPDMAAYMGTRLAAFFKDCLISVDSDLRDIGQRLIILKGAPADVLPEFTKVMGVTHIYAPDSSDPRELDTLSKIEAAVTCKVERIWQHTVFRPVEFAPVTNFPLIFNSFLNVTLDMREPDRPIPPPTPRGGAGKPWPLSGASASGEDSNVAALYDSDKAYTLAGFSADDDTKLKSTETLAGFVFEGQPKMHTLGTYMGMEYWWNPETERCEKDASKNKIKFSPMKYIQFLPGGEVAGIKRLGDYLSRLDVRDFRKSSVRRHLDTPNNKKCYSSGMSPYISAGCISIRLFYHAVAREYLKSDPAAITSLRSQRYLFAESMLCQVYWREFFIQLSYIIPHFQSYENPVLVKPTWAEKSHEIVGKLANAQTGVPIIDASMTQLRTYGWLNHTLRHKVADFLTRSGLVQNWTEGVKIFRYFQLDYEYGVNECNWMWQSRTAFVSLASVHELNQSPPVEVEEGEGIEYIREQLPVFKKMPDEHIFRPWLAPDDVQQASKCVIGKDYPPPMCDMSAQAQRTRNIEMATSILENSADVVRTHYVVPKDKFIGQIPERSQTTDDVNDAFARMMSGGAPPTAIQRTQSDGLENLLQTLVP